MTYVMPDYIEWTQAEVRELYWGTAGERGEVIGCDVLAFEMGIPMHLLPRIAGPIISSVLCSECGEGIVVTSRSAHKELRAKAAGRGRYREEVLCAKCRDVRTEKLIAQRNDQQGEWNDRTRQLKTMPYAEYLKTDHWKQRAAYARRSAGFRCQLCNAGGELNVHHRTYERRGEEHYSDLIVLCRPCHEKFHGVTDAT